MAEATVEYELGEHGDRTYFPTARATPGFDDPEEVAAVVHFNDSAKGAEIQIARIDTAHDSVHVDRRYRRDKPKDDHDVDFWTAIERLEDSWRTDARESGRTRGD